MVLAISCLSLCSLLKVVVANIIILWTISMRHQFYKVTQNNVLDDSVSVLTFPPDSSLTRGSGCDDNTVPQKLLILDARSYTAAVANRAKGGGCECEGEDVGVFFFFLIAHVIFPQSYYYY